MKQERRIATTLLAIVCCLSTVTLTTTHATPPDNGNDNRPLLNIGQTTRGHAAVQALGDKLPDVARAYGMTAQELREKLVNDQHMRLDRNGRLFIEDAFEVPQGAGTEPDTTPVVAESIPLADTFKLHSRPGAERVIYLDFDGHVMSGTAWNAGYNNNQDIACPAYNFEGDASSFTTNELTRIQQVWQRVAEDFAPFDVDVTTEYPGEDAITRSSSSDTRYGMRVLISPISSYFGNYGGIAYIGVFNRVGDYYKPALVFPEKLSNNAKYIAEACSHEAGHTLGLQHDGTTTGTTYYAGHGTGETSWAPIMGNSYSKNVTQWSKGEYTNANQTQDDLGVIQSYGLALRADDHGNDNLAASYLAPGVDVLVTGLIESNADADVIAITTGAGPLALDILPAVLGPNLDIHATLYDDAGNLLATSNPADFLAASFRLDVPAGTCYLHVRGTGKDTPATGYSSYASLGAYTVTGTVTGPSGNTPPVAHSTASTQQGPAPLLVNFDGTASFDLDGNIVSHTWNFGDGATGTGATVSHTYTIPGTYTATLTVIDNLGAIASSSLQIQVQPQSDPEQIVRIASIHLTVIAVKGGSRVQATVIVTDTADNPIPGATVTGSWSGKVRGSSSGVTDQTGAIVLTSSKTSKTGLATFTVTGVSAPGYTYDPAQNLVTSVSATKRIRRH
jgi:PKD repeat protein